MKKTLKNLITIALFCIIGLLLYLRLYHVFSWKDTADNYNSTLNTFYQMEPNTADVLFLGSSHCYCTIDVSNLWREHGISALSLSISGQDLVSSYYCIEEALKTQHPKVVCLEVFCTKIHGYEAGSDGNLYRNTIGLRPSITSYRTVRDIAEDNKELKINLLSRWPIIHTRYRELDEKDFVQNGPRYMGFQCDFRQDPDISWRGNGYQYCQDETPIAIEPTEEEWVRKIISLCNENNIELCMFVAPYAAYDKEQQQFRYVENIASENNVAFLDFIRLKDDAGVEDPHDFIDWGHLNYWGAQKVSSYIGNYLSTNYQLKDHRGEKGYEIWTENAEKIDHEKIAYELKTNANPVTYINNLSQLDNYIILVSTVGTFQNEDIDISSIITPLGIPAEQFASGGSWLIDGDAVEYVPHTGDYSKHWVYGNKTISVMGSPDNNYVYVNHESKVLKENGIVILVYDNFLQEVVDCSELSTEDSFMVLH